MSSIAAVGDVLAGKYRVDRVLGIGGMGMVVAATHLELEQRVALKFMLPAAITSEQAMDRFLREAKAAVRLRSEHICRVLDVGKLETGAPYIVMELMDGQDFAQLIKASGPLVLADAVDHVLQAIEGLAEAHANGIVHRDLKPGNLFVCADNDGSALVKVLDFGISKSSLGAGAMATKTGDVMGSPAYMAPEQMLSSKNVDGRADVWALGVILYQAVTGVLPFEAETLPALCMAVMNTEPPSPEQLRAALPPGFGAVVMRCLTKNPEARWPNVAALATALAPFGGEDAAASARRTGKVLRRTVGGTPTARAAVDASGLAPTLMTDSDAALATPVPLAGRISTLQASAAEVAVASTTVGARRSRGPLIAAIGALAVAAIIGIAVTVGRGGGGASAAAQPLSPPAPVPAAPASAPTQPAPPLAAAAAAPLPPAVAPIEPPPPPPAVARPTSPATPHAAPRHSVLATPTPTPTPTPVPVTAPPPTVDPPAANPDDKWTHMQHDKASH